MDQLPELKTDVPHLPTAEVADRSNPMSVINLAPKIIGEAIDEALFLRPELFEKDERDLHKTLRSEYKTPSPTDNRLRLKFWAEWDRVMTQGGRMKLDYISSGMVTGEYFRKHYLKRPEKVAWMLCPPTAYMLKTEEALEFGIEQLREILEHEINVLSKDATKWADLKIKIVALLDTRVKGAPVQKTMNLHASMKDVGKVQQAQTMEELQAELKKLEREARKAQNLPDAPIPGKPDIEIMPE